MQKQPSKSIFVDLMPIEPLMAIAWVDGLRWALGDEEIAASFRKDTGIQWHPGRTPIDRMIDEAAGADREFLIAFAKWFNQNLWGEVDGRARKIWKEEPR